MARPAKTQEQNGSPLAFEATLWAAADALRNNMDAAEYKHVVLGLIFLKDFPEYPVLMPPDSLVRKFEETVTPIWAKIHANQAESATLRGLRDALLPQLLSGEIRVNTLNPTREGLR